MNMFLLKETFLVSEIYTKHIYEDSLSILIAGFLSCPCTRFFPVASSIIYIPFKTDNNNLICSTCIIIG